MGRECLAQCLKTGNAKRVFGQDRIFCFDKNGCTDKTMLKDPKENCFECMQLMREKVEKSREMPNALKEAWGIPVDKNAKRGAFAEFDLL
jgi:hypothetical protein